MVIAIDGPAGAGKSTVARAVAQRLGFTYLDTGAMYRCVGLAVNGGSAPAAEIARRIRIEVFGHRVLLDGRDVTEAIRTPRVSEAASCVAADPTVRAAMISKQRAIVAEGDWVAEGRDIGTVVATDAMVKLYLYASPEERARRRAVQSGVDPIAVLAHNQRRDLRDSSAQRSVFEPAPDAVPVDTTGLTVDEVVEQVVFLAAEGFEAQALSLRA